MLIRNFIKEDYQQLINLWELSGLPCKPKGRDSFDNISKQISLNMLRILVVENDTQIVASVLVSHDGRKGWINRLAVNPAFRNKGIAVSLVHEAEKFLSSVNIEVISCLINKNNHASRELFTKEGYSYDPEILYFSKRKDINS